MTPQPGREVLLVGPGSFEAVRHYYPQVLGARVHPLVERFLAMDHGQVAAHHARRHPEANPGAVARVLATVPRHFHWAGADLFNVATEDGRRHLVVLETNSSPSGQKSMPRGASEQPSCGYRRLIEGSFLPCAAASPIDGDLAVVYDKNAMECSGYAAALADATGERVLLVPVAEADRDPPLRVHAGGVLHVRGPAGWRPVRAALRYLTQQPWTRLPPVTATVIYNPVLACLAGGRNKALAARAYADLNAEVATTGLRIETPETLPLVPLAEVRAMVAGLGGAAVIKTPYSNAGQGIFTVVGPGELDAFMRLAEPGARFVVQALVGHAAWDSRAAPRLHHVGTVPCARGEVHVADLRFVVSAGPQGFSPAALYARRARRPLRASLDGVASRQVLLTNLSVRAPDGSWRQETERLLPVDHAHFDALGLGLDELVDAYLQTVLAVLAIDRMAARLLRADGSFDHAGFAALNPDPRLAAALQA